MMSKIQFEQINDEIVEISIPAETPMEIVQQLTKSLTARGLVEDVQNSTLSTRYFYRPQDKLNKKADELIKSLQQLAKNDDEEPYWTDKSKRLQQIKNRKLDIVERQRKAGVNVTPKPPTPPSTGPVTISGTPNKLVGEVGENRGYSQSSMNYAKKLKQSESHDMDEQNEEDEDFDKSNSVKPFGHNIYDEKANVKRKMNNTGEQTGFGGNVNTKRYTTAKFSNSTPQTDPKIKKPQPVKQFTTEQIQEMNRQRNLKKGWANHNSIPSAEEEILKLARETAQSGEDAMANQLAKMMQSKAMLGGHQQPTEQEMIMMGEQMGLGAPEQVLKTEESKWGNTLNNWLIEASKPIAQRFNSEEEEMAYWDKIKIGDRDDGSSGY